MLTGEPVQEQLSVQMVGLMLEAGGQQTGGLDPQRFAFGAHPGQHGMRVSGDGSVDVPGHGEASFAQDSLFALGALPGDERRVSAQLQLGVNDRTPAAFHIPGEDAQAHPDLRCSDADAAGIIVGGIHILHEFANAVIGCAVFERNWVGGTAQNRITDLPDVENRHADHSSISRTVPLTRQSVSGAWIHRKEAEECRIPANRRPSDEDRVCSRVLFHFVVYVLYFDREVEWSDDVERDVYGNDPVISASGVQMRYGDKQVLNGLDLRVETEEVVALLGPNGAGKSTTVEILEGFRVPSAGEVTVLGTDPARGDDAWRSRLGVVLQSTNDHGKWRCRQLLSHIADFYQPYVEPWPIDELLELVGLTDQANQKLQTLSGGQRRRLDVAMGVVGRPPLLFLDEPTTGFDPRAKRDFHDLVHRLSDLQGTTILLTTHDLAEAEKLANRIVILAGGSIIADGSAQELTRAVSRTSEISWMQDGQLQVHASENATEFVRELLASDGGAVTDLQVSRSTLEDAYLSIVEQFEAGESVESTQFEEVAS